MKKRFKEEERKRRLARFKEDRDILKGLKA